MLMSYARRAFLFVALVFSSFYCVASSAPSVAEYAFPPPSVDSSYRDEELVDLWNSLSDIYHPSSNDYLKFQEYLQHGRRPYLDTLFHKIVQNGWVSSENLDRSQTRADRILQQFRFVGPKGEMPFQKTVVMGGATLEDRSSCIIMYSSYNFDNTYGPDLYSAKMQRVVRDLEEEGYRGHVLFRLGGYPLEEKGGLRLAHVPYSFKILSFIEAAMMGYQEVLWIDTSIHPSNDLSSVFSTIRNNGYFLLSNESMVDSDYQDGIIPDDTVHYCGLTGDDLSHIPHMAAGIVGLSFRNRSQSDFMEEWYRLTAATLPAMSLYPEEFLIAVAAWKTKKPPTGHFSDYIYGKLTVPSRPHQAQKPFWYDKN